MRIALLLLVACGGKPISEARGRKVEIAATLSVGPGNIAVTADKRMFVSQHQFYAPKHPVVEVRGLTGGNVFDRGPKVGAAATNDTIPFPDPAKYEKYSDVPSPESVLGIRADDNGIVWMLDNGMRGPGARFVAGWNTKADGLELHVDLQKQSYDDSFLNDLAVDTTNNAIYIADPAGGKNAAVIVVDLASTEARRVLEGHESVIPTDIDLVIDGTPVQIKLPDGNVIKPHVGVNPIALDTKDEWLYFGPMHAKKLYRVRTADLRDKSLAPDALAKRVEVYADRPITEGISIDQAGYIYLGDLANNAIGFIDQSRTYHEIARGPEMSWIDAFSFGPDGHYYVVANQLHRSAFLNAGTDATKPPFHILRFKPYAPGRVGR